MIWGQNPLPAAAAVFQRQPQRRSVVRRGLARAARASRLDGGGGMARAPAPACRSDRRHAASGRAVRGGGRRSNLGDADARAVALRRVTVAAAGVRAARRPRSSCVQRGWLWLLLLLICTAFMRTDRSEYEAGRRNLLSAQDQLISDFAEGVNSLRTGDSTGGAHPSPAILVASSWPARTSIACRCDGLPLPPAAKDPDSQLAMMRGVSYVILGDNADNRALAINFAQLGPRIEVLSRRARRRDPALQAGPSRALRAGAFAMPSRPC